MSLKLQFSITLLPQIYLDYFYMQELNQIQLSLIIPAYKAGKFLNTSLIEKVKVIKSLNINYEIIIVIDGFDKYTIKSIKHFKKNKHIRIIKYDKNHGKGYAVRQGFTKAKGDIISYMDADNDINPNVIKRGYLEIIKGNYDAIIPSKNHSLSIINYPNSRKKYSKIYNYIVNKIFKLNITDTQLGAKIYTKELVKSVIPYCKINGFAFELEMIKIASKIGYNKFLEIPVEVNLKTKSTISFLNGIKVLWDTIILIPRIKLFNVKKIKKQY